MPSSPAVPSADVELSMFISSVLRHRLDELGFARDAQGWVTVDELLEKSTGQGLSFSRTDLERIVAQSSKKRFALSEDGQRVRANQGHSIPVDLGLAVTVPPPVLYHGTATRFLDSILAQGLVAQGRHAVHLSTDPSTAATVGRRYGRVVILEIDTVAMQAAGHTFQRSENGVWLTGSVPVTCLRVVAAPAPDPRDDPAVVQDEKPRPPLRKGR